MEAERESVLSALIKELREIRIRESEIIEQLETIALAEERKPEQTLRVERASLGPKYHRVVVPTIQHLGQVHQQRGELSEALAYYREALEIQQLADNPDLASIGQTLNHIGNVYLQRGDANEMVDAFSEALRCFLRSGKSEDELCISGLNFYGLSKLHPECSPAA